MVSFPRYERYKDSGVEWLGEIPEHWGFKKLKYILKFHTGGTPTSGDSKYYEGNHLWASISDLQSKFITNTKSKINDSGVMVANIPLTPKGSLLFSFKLSIGHTGFAGVDLYTNEAIASFLKTPNECLEFWFYALPIFVIKNSYKNIYGANLLNQELIKNASLLRPSLEEQNRIVEFLDRKTEEIDRAIAHKKRLIELLEEQKTILINQAVTKGLNPNAPMKDSGIEWLGKIPEHWKVIRLKFLLNEPLKYGANEEATEQKYDNPRYIRITDFSEDGTLRNETFRSLPWNKAQEYLLEDGDILFARSGATVGKTFFFYNYQGKACFAGYLIKASPKKNLILPKFLYLYTKTPIFDSWKGIIFSKSTIQNIGADKYSILPVITPKIEEQNKIIEFLDRKTEEIDRAIAHTKHLIKKLTELKQILIAEAVTGEIKV